MELRANVRKKREWVQHLREELQQYPALILVDPMGIKALEDRQIRQLIKAVQGRYRLIKNRLALRALEGTPFEPLKDYIRGMTAMAMHSDGVALAKVLRDLTREFSHLHFRAAWVEGQLFTEKQLDFLATLPPREVLQAQLLGALQGPMSSLVRVLAAPMQQVLLILHQVKEQRPQNEGGKPMAEITKEQVIEYLSNLSVTQLVELVKELEERWGVQAAAAVPVAMAGMPQAGGAAEAAEEKQITYSVVITDAGQQKVQLIKALREIFPDLGLKEAKAMVDQLPKTIKEGLSREEAEELAATLTQVGATVEIK